MERILVTILSATSATFAWAASAPQMQYQIEATGYRSVTVFATCAETKNFFTVQNGVSESVNKIGEQPVKLRILPPKLIDAELKGRAICSATCAPLTQAVILPLSLSQATGIDAGKGVICIQVL